MRPDMHKVVVERPRWNPGPGKQNRRANQTEDQVPKSEGIRRPYQTRKASRYLLGPLERWLRAQMGRPWNAVYSELCAVIKPDGAVRQRIKRRLLGLVERDTFMHDGEICVIQPCYGTERRIFPIYKAAHGRIAFYVHPETFLLCEIPRRKWPKRINPVVELRKRTARWLSAKVLLRQLNGCWFECRMEPFPARYAKGQSPWRFDLAERKLICRRNAYDLYGKVGYCVQKRQLSRHELKKFGLANHIEMERSLQSALPWPVEDCVLFYSDIIFN